ncbi:hypothetical protein K491DRAFT_700336 [Lophiostoma macrostomum CBS 122681]|uniref:Zn(2)-C6 fungal-type domain-containing protein n=1 Tax=Lophiostoma macrostomum CBS 122681 TaxID=1314788 RepID=A0A6A6TT13_9PLEO|nr:hypothetical protein K491DRAFT_700336 [Lophiostoma macrostomum CBS 122681]
MQAPTQSSSQTQARAVPPRRIRVALACQRCKGRKQRCDGQTTCKSCSKAGVNCVYEPTLRPRYPGGKMLYINALEERIAFLEAQLPEHGQDHFGNLDPQKGTHGNHNRQLSSSTTSPLDDIPDEGDSSIVDGVAYLSLCASGTTDAAPEPFYMGSSSGATIARMIQSSIFRARESITSPKTLDTLRSGSFSSVASSLLTPQPGCVSCEFPPPPQAQRLFSVFFNRLHTRWPILDRKIYEEVYEHQYNQDVLPVIEKSSLHMIYAISARYMQLTKQATDVDPEVHFSAAIEAMDVIMEQHNSSTVQFLALLAIYGQRSPYGAGVWSQVRYSITLCVELGMHRKPTSHSPTRDPRDLEIRRRVFWSCYCLDRLTSNLLGRTFAISDRDINVELPSEDPVFWDLTSTEPPADKGWSNVMPFVHIIKLRQLQSRIQRTVFRVDQDPSSRSFDEQARFDAKVARIRSDLDHWINVTPVPPPSDENGPNWMYQPETTNSYHDSRDFFTLQYHKTILSLYTALLPSLAVSDQRYVSCAQSSARICSIYKRLNQQKILSFTIIGLHSCFVAGLTLIYCLWRDKTSFNFDILEATRSCSQCLTIFGEKWSGAVKYGEIFESLSGSVLRAIMEPNEKGASDLKITLDTLSESSPAASGSSRGKAYDPLLGAVKNVFMEVDEDMPGGWQGWRVFNEMVQSDIQDPTLATGGISESGGLPRNELASPQWNSNSDLLGAGFDNGSASMNSTTGFGTQSGWNPGFFAGYD